MFHEVVEALAYDNTVYVVELSSMSKVIRVMRDKCELGSEIGLATGGQLFTTFCIASKNDNNIVNQW